MKGGFATTLEKPIEEPKTQTASSGSFIGGGKRKAPPHTPYKRRGRKVGDRIRTPNNKIGTIIQIRKNGHEDYLVSIPRVGKRWYSEFDL